jgi:putative membrane protein insertion efficiency factor
MSSSLASASRWAQVSSKTAGLFVTIFCVFVAAAPGASVADESPKRSLSLSASAIGFYQKYISDLRYGHCRFDPSCSNYCADVIQAKGIFMGTVLTADRLIRCNAGAPAHYAKEADGRLDDPAVAPPAVGSRPEVPLWLLPLAAVPPFPARSLEAQPLDLDWRRPKSAADLEEYAAFADALAVAGDCWRAETEYKRVAFLAPTDEVKRWALMKTGSCYYHWREWDRSATAFAEAVDASLGDTDRNVARFMTAASYFNAGEYAASAEVLNSCVIAGPPERLPAAEASDRGYTQQERIALLGGLCSMASGDWQESALYFDGVAMSPDSPNRNQALFLKQKARAGEASVRQKHPTLAATLSVVPGMGQMYAGRYFDGFRYMVFDGLLILSTYQLFKHENYAAGYLLAGFTLPFYLGSIVGAHNAVESYDASRRAEYVSDVIDEAGTR